MIITKIEIQKKRKNRCNLYLDDEFAFGLDQEIVYKFGLRKGDRLSEDEINKILLAEEQKKAKERALKFLSYRDRSEKEIRDKLKDIGYNASIIEWVINELKRLKLIDDARFAYLFAKSKISAKPMGEFLLRRELLKKGLGEGLIFATIEKIYQEKNQFELAKELVEKQLKKYRNLDEFKVKKKINDFLLRRGFSWDVINEVLPHN